MVIPKMSEPPTTSQKRQDKLYEIGLTYNGKSFCKDDINVHWTELVCCTDEEFNKIVSDIEAEIQRREHGD